jgi:glycosyltransferase involved in cell wall biosynthesis
VRIVAFSERLRPPFDEGIKSFTLQLIQALRMEHDVLALTSGGKPSSEHGVVDTPVSRLLLSGPLRRAIRAFAPRMIVYIPTACGTVFSFLRARTLRQYGRGVPTGLVTLQPRPYTAAGKWWIGRLATECTFAQSRRTAGDLADLGHRIAVLPPAVDSQRFSPVSRADRESLRQKYSIPTDVMVATHVGHLKGKRRLEQIASLQAGDRYHIVIVGSTSTEQDGRLRQSLVEAGCTVIDHYVEDIADIYRLSDVYLFLAEEHTAAIEMPLSVLEAMACNLPVVCTPFGGLPDAFEAGNGLVFWEGDHPLMECVDAALAGPCATRTLVEGHTWHALTQVVVQSLQPGAVLQ